MRDKWTGDVVKKMHIFEISNKELAAEMSRSASYVSDILNCRERPKNAKQKMNEAIERILSRRGEIETR